MIRGWFCIFLLVASIALPLYAQNVPAPSDSTPQSPGLLEPNVVLDKAEALLQKHEWKAAHDLIVPWLQSYPKSPDRDRGLFLLAELYYHWDQRLRAFYHLDELMDNFPESKLFFPALELQYQIADEYLNGYKEKFLGMRIIPQTDEAVEMLYRIQERSPGSPLAERALRRTADYYFNSSEFDLAGDAYGAFLRLYPRSPEVPQVRLRQAFASLAQFRGPRFDTTPLVDARAEFKDVQARYPDLAADVNVANWLDRIDSDLARKAYTDADFYRRTNQPRGAVYLYRYVIQTFPNTHEADLARRDLAKVPKWALADPRPPLSNTDSVASQPAVPLGPPLPGANERPQ
jgi:outer membrane assembly lipoprotein YfiO